MSKMLLKFLNNEPEKPELDPAEIADDELEAQPELINNFNLEEFMMARRIIDINCGIDAKSVQHWINQLDILASISSDPILFRINSGGGNMDDGLALYDVIRMYADAGLQMNAIVLGKCCSMATVVLLACDNRESLPNANFMVHSASLGIPASQMSIADSTNLDVSGKRYNHQIAKIYAARAGDTVKSWTAFLNTMVFDYYFDRKEAKKLGFLTR